MELGEIYYNANSQWLLNAVLASIVFGVALNINWLDFKHVLKMPKAIGAGLTAQFLLLPAATTGLTLLLELPAGVELGMILVASCPGGAISNYVTQLAGGNTALSISMTAVASVLAIFLLPINFLFYASLNPVTDAMLQSINVDGFSLFITLFIVLAIPLIAGLTLNRKAPKLANTLHKLLNKTSFVALIAFISIAVARNFDAFSINFTSVFFIVLLHNALAYGLGFLTGYLSKLDSRDTKATTIEVGMQNSSLAVAIVFSQFNAEAGMALISAFWGTWHIISGLTVALCFKRIGKTTKSVEALS